MLIYSLVESNNIYSKASRSLWQYCRDEPDLNNDDDINDFPADNDNSFLFNLKEKIMGETGNDGTKDV